jgi:hypothetical protein
MVCRKSSPVPEDRMQERMNHTQTLENLTIIIPFTYVFGFVFAVF